MADGPQGPYSPDHPASTSRTMNVEQARFNMIEQQIRPGDVLEPSVLGLLARVRREDFVPEAHQALAFVDTQVPLIEGSPQGTCMLEPRV
ncbi:MAG: hypothetical protein ACK559_04120, partial [bacterium]